MDGSFMKPTIMGLDPEEFQRFHDEVNRVAGESLFWATGGQPPRTVVEPEHPEIPKSTYVPLATQLLSVPDKPLTSEVAGYIKYSRLPCVCGHPMREHEFDKYKCSYHGCNCIHYESPETFRLGQ